MSNKKIICNDIDGEKYEVTADKFKWRPGVYGILIKDEKILLSPQYDGYDFPGGGQEIWETIDETLQREFWEETGFKIKRKELITVGSNFYYAKKRREYWNSHLIYYLVEYVSGELSVEGFDEDEKKYARLAEWVDLNMVDELLYYNSVDSPAIIQQAIKVLKYKNI